MGASIGVRAGAAHWAVFGAIIFVAILLRVVAIDTQSLWTDEALTIVLSNWSIGDMFLKPTDPTPFLYYALHKMLVPPDASVAAMRSISLVAGVLSIGLIYVVGRLAFGAWGGLLAAALLAVSRMHVDYSQEARAYSVLFFLTLLTSVGFLWYARILKAQPAGRDELRSASGKFALVLFGVGNVLSFYTHVVSVYWIALTSLLLLAVVVREQRRRLIEVGVLFFAMAMGALPGLYRLALQMKIGDDFDWLEQRGLVGFIRLCVEIYLPLGFWDTTAADYGLATITKAIVLVFSILALGAGFWLGRRQILAWSRERPYVLWLTLAYLLVPVIMWLQGFVARPILIGRGMLYSVPGMILLITGLCLALDRRAAIWAGASAFALYGISLALTGTIREREDWRGAYAFLARAVAPGDIIAVCPAFNYPALRYHAAVALPADVVVVTDGRLAEIEKGLGSDEKWDQTYFRKLIYPQLMARLKDGPASVDDSGAKAIELARGRSIWRVDGHCGALLEEMDRALSAAGPDPGVTRFFKEAPRAGAISIRQYRVAKPTTLEALSLSEPQSPASP